MTAFLASPGYPSRDCVDLLNKNLPKWSKMWTTGRPVTIDQAKEIIRRTDSFFLRCQGGRSGVDDWERALARRLRMPHLWADHPRAEDDWCAWETARDHWIAAWGGIVTTHAENDWINSCFVYGPHGWCHPDGHIAFVDNVGKWSHVQDVVDDWRQIAQAFPFLDLAATLLDGSDDDKTDIRPVVTVLVRQGEARLVEGSMRHHEAYPAASRRTDEEEYMGSGHGPIPDAWYDEWEQIARSRIAP